MSGQPASPTLCWAWWLTGDKPGYHRCMHDSTHCGLHECCCGAETDTATNVTAQQGPPPRRVKLPDGAALGQIPGPRLLSGDKSRTQARS
jgi:hypothetical protein